MSNLIVDQVLGEFLRRLPNVVAEELTRAEDNVVRWAEIVSSARGAPGGNQVYVASEWLVSVLEIFARGQLIPAVHDARIHAAISAVTEKPRRSEQASSWRLGLVGDYLKRAEQTNPDANGDTGLAYRISEYISLVEEFQSSETGRAFLQTASPLAGYGTNHEFDQLTRKLHSIYSRAGVADPDVIDGAAQFMTLVENSHSQLMELKGTPGVQSACWRFHGDLFTRRQVFEFGYSLLFGDDHTLRATYPFVYRIPIDYGGGQDRLHAQLVQDRSQRLRQVWLNLSAPQRWTKDGGALSWKVVVGLSRSPNSWYVQATEAKR